MKFETIILISIFTILFLFSCFVFLHFQFVVEPEKNAFCKEHNLLPSSFGGTYCLNISGDTYQQVSIIRTKYGIKFIK